MLLLDVQNYTNFLARDELRKAFTNDSSKNC